MKVRLKENDRSASIGMIAPAMCFEYDDSIFITSVIEEGATVRNCLNLDTGEIKQFHLQEVVTLRTLECVEVEE